MTTFIALYRGKSVGSAQLIAVSADVFLVANAAKGLLGSISPHEEDPILNALQERRLDALRLVAQMEEGQTQDNNLRGDAN